MHLLIKKIAQLFVRGTFVLLVISSFAKNEESKPLASYAIDLTTKNYENVEVEKDACRFESSVEQKSIISLKL